jgi:hypothetical protein
VLRVRVAGAHAAVGGAQRIPVTSGAPKAPAAEAPAAESPATESPAGESPASE